MKLKHYLTVCTLTASSLIVFAVTAAVLLLLNHSEQQALQRRGTELANIVAHSPQVIEAVNRSNAGDTSVMLQSDMEQLRSKTDASYIVVVNRQGIRLSHPDKEKLGQHFIGQDIAQALVSPSVYTTEAKGSLGKAIRNFMSITDANHHVIGAVCVGYLSEKISDIFFSQAIQIAAIIFVIYLLGSLTTLTVFNKMKRTFFNYEPEYLAHKFKQYELMFDSIRDAIIAVDANLLITGINKQAATILSRGNYSKSDYMNRPLSRYSESLSHFLTSGVARIQQQDVVIGKTHFTAMLYPIQSGTTILGYVIVFFPQSEGNALLKELEYFKNYAELLRTKTHEYSNKLNVLSGMLQMGKTDECINYIQQETDHYQSLVHQIIVSIADSAIAGLLLAKFNKASDMNVGFRIDQDSALSDYPKDVAERLSTITGNLIDNALLAAWQNRQQVTPAISIYLSDRSQHVIIEVEDNGAGIAKNIADHILDFGISSKTDDEQSGIGLYLVNQMVNYYNGTVEWERTEADTTLFSIYLPKANLTTKRQEV